MSTKSIPAQTIKTCDCCGVVMDSKTARQDGGLVLKADALDMHGIAVADASRRIDLCDTCLYVVGTAIDTAIAAHKATAQINANKE